MKLQWEISQADIAVVKSLAESTQNSALVRKRNQRNIDREDIDLSRDNILKKLLMCLLTSQQKSGPNSKVVTFLSKEPFPITEKELANQVSIRNFVSRNLTAFALERFKDKISEYFENNYQTWVNNNWKIEKKLKLLYNHPSKTKEIQLAQELMVNLKGIGPKQARNFLQALGLSQYETPIDSRIMQWLEEKVEFPLAVSYKGLSDPICYQMVADGFQQLSLAAGYLPCLLDAMIFSEKDANDWEEHLVVF